MENNLVDEVIADAERLSPEAEEILRNLRNEWEAENREIVYLIEHIGSLGILRIEQWRDSYLHWRAGFNWHSASSFGYVCAHRHIIDCLRDVKNFLDNNINSEEILSGVKQNVIKSKEEQNAVSKE